MFAGQLPPYEVVIVIPFKLGLIKPGEVKGCFSMATIHPS